MDKNGIIKIQYGGLFEVDNFRAFHAPRNRLTRDVGKLGTPTK